MDNVLLLSSRPFKDKYTVHFTKVLSNGPSHCIPEEDRNPYYLPSDIEPYVIYNEDTSDGPAYRKFCVQHGVSHIDYTDNTSKINAYVGQIHQNGYTTPMVPNIFQVTTRKFAPLVFFNAFGLSEIPKQPAFLVFQENLVVEDKITLSFMLYNDETLPKRPVYNGFNYVCSHNKTSLFVQATIVTI